MENKLVYQKPSAVWRIFVQNAILASSQQEGNLRDFTYVELGIQ